MSLPRVQSVAVAAVLEDCSDQVDVMRHTLTVRRSREQGPAAAQEKARLAKLRQDCQYISQRVFQLMLEVEEKQSFTSLLQVVEEVEEKKKAESMRRELEQRLSRREEECLQKAKTLDNLLQCAKKLKHQLQPPSNALNEEDTEEENIAPQMPRRQREGSQAEKQLEEQLELLKKQMRVEVRIHEESKNFLQNRHEELQQLLQHWQQRTKQMMQEKEQQLNSVCCKRTVALDKLMEMRRIFTEMEQVVLEDREEQEKLRQLEEEVRTATKLQAWWRGCMVRRGLGRFKAEEEKKGKKKKKKEGKKKKK